MNTEIIVSLLTLLGAILSVIIGYSKTLRTIDTELHKQHYGVLNIYAKGLFEKRLSVYSELYSILSNAVKIIDYPDLFTEPVNIVDIENKLNEWDSNYGLLLTKESGARAMTVRKALRTLSSKFTTIHDCLKDHESKEKLEESLVGLEVALRVDLGVYAVESWNIKKGHGIFTNRESPDYTPKEFEGRS